MLALTCMFVTRSASIAAKRGSAAILVGHVPAVGRRVSGVARTLQPNAENQMAAMERPSSTFG